ncbi:MAG: MFS transporter [Planctomycetota bacterium]
MSVFASWRAVRGLPRPIWLLCAATVVNRAGGMVLAFLALYVTQELGLTEDQAGVLLVLYGVGSVVSALLAGRYSDRIGPPRVMTISLVASGAILLAASFARSFVMFAVLLTAWALFAEAFRPAAMATVNTGVPPARRKQAISVFQVAINCGTTIGSGAGGFLYAAWPIAIFWVDGVTSLVAGVVLAATHGLVMTMVIPMTALASKVATKAANMPAMARARARGHVDAVRAVESALSPIAPLESAPLVADAFAPATTTSSARSTLPAWRDARLVALVAALFLVWIVVFQILGALPLTLVRYRGLSESQYGVLLGIESLLTVFVALPLTHWTQHWPHRRTLAVSALLVGVGFGGYAFAATFTSALLLMLVWSLGLILMFPASSAYLAELAPDDRQGEYAGFYSASFSVAFAFGPGIGTFAYNHGGPEWVFGGCFVICAIAATAFAFGRAPAAHAT